MMIRFFMIFFISCFCAIGYALAPQSSLKESSQQTVWDAAIAQECKASSFSSGDVSTAVVGARDRSSGFHNRSTMVVSILGGLLIAGLLMYIFYGALNLPVMFWVGEPFVLGILFWFVASLALYHLILDSQKEIKVVAPKLAVVKTLEAAIAPVEQLPVVLTRPTEEFLEKNMNTILHYHDGNHDLECGYDVVLLWLTWQGITQKDGTPYRIDDLRTLCQKYKTKTFSGRHWLANVGWATSMLDWLVNVVPRHHNIDIPEIPITLMRDGYALADSVIRTQFFSDVQRLLQERGMLMLTWGHTAVNIYDVDLDRETLKIVDPHEQGKKVLRELSWRDIVGKKNEPAKIFLYPEMKDDQRRVFLKNAFASLPERQEAHLCDEIWYKVFIAASQLHREWYGAPLQLRPTGKAYVQGIHTQFWQDVQQERQTRSEVWKQFQDALDDFKKNLVILDQSWKKPESLLHYILCKMPQDYRTMLKHYALIPLSEAIYDQSRPQGIVERVVWDTKTHMLEGDVTGKDSLGATIASIFCDHPQLLQLWQGGPKITIHGVDNMETPAEVFLDESLIRVNMNMVRESKAHFQLFLVSMLVHEFFRTQSEFRRHDRFSEIAKILPFERGLELNQLNPLLRQWIEGEAGLIIKELQWLYENLGEENWEEYLRQIKILKKRNWLKKLPSSSEGIISAQDWEALVIAFSDYQNDCLKIEDLNKTICSYIFMAAQA